jgi:hypothetical protein
MSGIRTRAKWFGVAVLGSAMLAAPAFAGPAASSYTPQALEAMSASWAAKGQLIGNPDAASFYTADQLEAMSTTWAAKGSLLGSRDSVSFYTPQQLQALSGNWAAKGSLVGSPDAASFYTPQQLQAMSGNWASKGSVVGASPASPSVSDDSGFQLIEFGIGASAMLGIVLLLGGLAVVVHHGRRGGVRAGTVS